MIFFTWLEQCFDYFIVFIKNLSWRFYFCCFILIYFTIRPFEGTIFFARTLFNNIKEKRVVSNTYIYFFESEHHHFKNRVHNILSTFFFFFSSIDCLKNKIYLLNIIFWPQSRISDHIGFLKALLTKTTYGSNDKQMERKGKRQASKKEFCLDKLLANTK